MSTAFTSYRNNKTRSRKMKGKGLTQKQKQQVKKLVEEPIEHKHFTEPLRGLHTSSTPSLTDMTLIGVGGASNDRIGNKIQLKSLSYKIRIQLDDATNYVRMVLFQWHPDNNIYVPSWDDIMQFSFGGLPVDQCDRQSPYLTTQGNTRQFRILMDREFWLDGDDTSICAQGFINKGFKKTISYSDLNALGCDHIYLLMVSDSTLGAHVVYNGYVRSKFTDA